MREIWEQNWRKMPEGVENPCYSSLICEKSRWKSMYSNSSFVLSLVSEISQQKNLLLSTPTVPDCGIKEFPRSGEFPPAVDTNQRLGRFRLPQQSIVCSIWWSSGLPAAYWTASGFAWLGPSSTSRWTWASSSQPTSSRAGSTSFQYWPRDIIMFTSAWLDVLALICEA